MLLLCVCLCIYLHVCTPLCVCVCVCVCICDDRIWKKRAEGAPHTDLFVTMDEINSWPAAKREKFLTLCYQVDDNLHCGFDPDKEPIYEELIEDYINHSCDGNTWYEVRPYGQQKIRRHDMRQQSVLLLYS